MLKPVELEIELFCRGMRLDASALEGAGARPINRTRAGLGSGLEIVSKVNDIPKGSRLAVSTNLLASLIALLMRVSDENVQQAVPPQADHRVAVAVS